MKIKSIDIFQHALPVKGGAYQMANAKVSSLTTTLVKMTASNGQYGWGECCPVGPTYAPAHARGALAALIQMAPDIIGQEISGTRQFHRKIDRLLNGHNYAKAALDIALHDLIGKST